MKAGAVRICPAEIGRRGERGARPPRRDHGRHRRRPVAAADAQPARRADRPAGRHQPARRSQGGDGDPRQPLARRAHHPRRHRGRQGAGHLRRPDAPRRRADLLPRGAQPRHHRRQRGAGRSRRRLAVLPDRARRQRPRSSAATACAWNASPISSRTPTRRRSTTGDIIMGFDIPAPKAPLRWGFAKVARKSGAFAHSIAIATTQGKDGPVSVVLGAAGPASPSDDRDRAQLTLIAQLRRSSCARRSRPTSTPISPGSTPIRSGCTPRTSCAPCGTCGPNDCDHPRIEWREDQRRRRAASDAGRLPARPLRADRDASRLRAWRLRRLHRDGGRRCDALLPDARRDVRRPRRS